MGLLLRKAWELWGGEAKLLQKTKENVSLICDFSVLKSDFLSSDTEGPMNIFSLKKNKQTNLNDENAKFQSKILFGNGVRKGWG